MADRQVASMVNQPVEVWHLERKVTVYDDVVLRVWGTDIEGEMSEVPRTMETVQAAFDWLYSAELRGPDHHNAVCTPT